MAAAAPAAATAAAPAAATAAAAPTLALTPAPAPAPAAHAPAPAPAARFSAEQMQSGKASLKRAASCPAGSQASKRVDTGKSLLQHLEKAVVLRRGQIKGKDEGDDSQKESQEF